VERHEAKGRGLKGELSTNRAKKKQQHTKYMIRHNTDMIANTTQISLFVLRNALTNEATGKVRIVFVSRPK
jgi:hypothetical protein